MRDYRLYLLDFRGHVLSAVELDCGDDEDALFKANEVREGRHAELWQRARRLQIFDPSHAAVVA